MQIETALYSSHCSRVGIVTAYEQGDRRTAVRFPTGSRIVTSPYRPDRYWDPPNLLFNGHLGLIPRSKAAGA
jgi:hypothetical protein